MKQKIKSLFICHHEILIVFVTAFLIRLLFWNIFGTYISIHNSDSIEYIINSIDFQPWDFHKVYWGYDHWYERTPMYVLFLHIIHRKLVVQVLLSALSCVFMFRINKTAGMLWTFYPQEIMYSFQYGKETLLLFFVIGLIYVFRKHRKYLLLAIPLIILGFVSYGGVISSNRALSKGFMLNFWNLWKPAFDVTIHYSKGFVYVQFLPYVLAIFFFIRKVKLLSVEFGIFSILTLMYCLIYSGPRYREPFMPLLFLFVAEPLRLYVRKFNIKSIKDYAFNKYSEFKNKIAIPEYARSFKPVSLTFIIVFIKTILSKL